MGLGPFLAAFTGFTGFKVLGLGSFLAAFTGSKALAPGLLTGLFMAHKVPIKIIAKPKKM